MSARRVKRERSLAAEAEVRLEAVANEAALASKQDAELFTIDTAGSSRQRRKVAKAVKHAEEGLNIVSKVEETLVKRVMAKMVASKGVVKAATATAATTSSGLDLWGEDAPDVKPRKALKNRPKSAAVKKEARAVLKKGIIPGSSYNPSHRDHQQALAAALGVETKRAEVEASARNAAKDKSISALRHYSEVVGYGDEGGADGSEGSGSDDESDDEEEEDGEGDDKKQKKKKAKTQEKLTRAQRNKLKERRARETAEATKRSEKDLLKQVNATAAIVKQLRREEDAAHRANKSLKSLKKATATAKAKEVRVEELVSVPLTSELRGSLRTIRPVGNPMALQVAKMEDAGTAVSRTHRKRRANEVRNAPKRIKWVPKYKSHGN